MGVEVEASGATVEEAIQIALEELGVERNDVDVEILDEASKGFLGLGSHSAKVIVRVKPEILTGVPSSSQDVASVAEEMDYEPFEEEPSRPATEEDMALVDSAQRFVEGLLERMGIDGSVEAEWSEGAPQVYIDGDDMGLLIGRGGETLMAAQTLLSSYLSRQAGHKVYSFLDIQGYRERKKESLEGLAERISERVAMTKKSYTMRPMPAAERRIIHMTLKSNPRVESRSEGDEPQRRVVIYPKG